MVPLYSVKISRVPTYSKTIRIFTYTGLSPTLAWLSIHFYLLTYCHWAVPRSLAATSRISVDFFSSGYWDVSLPRVRLIQLCIHCMIPHKWWVSPFGNPRVKECWPLIGAYRSLPRPSSPSIAKAFTRCPSKRLNSYHAQGKNHCVSIQIWNRIDFLSLKTLNSPANLNHKPLENQEAATAVRRLFGAFKTKNVIWMYFELICI